MNIINYITPELIPGLRALWKDAFGDSDAFLDAFFSTGFAPERCRCIVEEGKILAALYWFDVTCQDRKLAYLYAIATDSAHRNLGLCRRLVEDTRSALTARGYEGLLLVPEDGGLSRMYGKMGFAPCTTVSEFLCGPQIPAAAYHKIDRAIYQLRRRDLLPKGSALQEGENLAFLEAQATFYSGPGFLAAAVIEGTQLRCLELLGDESAAPGLVTALGCSSGSFRCPGKGKDFAMLCPLTPDCPTPTYFGLAFD